MPDRDPERAELHRQFEQVIADMGLDDLKDLAGQLLSFGSRVSAEPEQRPSLRKPRRNDPAILRLRVDLEHAKPPIWRRLDVRSDTGLDVFHQVLQGAFGWTDSHLHRFALGSPFDRKAELFLCPFDVEEGEDEGIPEEDVTLDETLAVSGDVLRYCYDYGDSWDLSIALESVMPLAEAVPFAVCIDGRRAAPPEDCGGLRDAADLAEILEDPGHFDLDEINQALNDPYLQLCNSGIDPRLVDITKRLRYTEMGDELVLRLMSLAQDSSERPSAERSAALNPFLWFLDHVDSEGLPLTSAGYLKPHDVRASAAVIPGMTDWIGTANVESRTYPVLWFRESLQKLGLIRKYRGRLLLTKAGSSLRDNPDRLWRYIADRLPIGKVDSIDIPASLIAMTFAASNPVEHPPMGRIAGALNDLGWRHSDRSPVGTTDIQWAIQDTFRILENMTIGPRRWMERHQLSPVAVELVRDALQKR